MARLCSKNATLTVQITIRDTKDCFYMYEVPPSRLIGPLILRSGLEHLDDGSLDV